MNKVLTAEEILRKHIQEFKHPVELPAIYDEDYAGGKYLCINESVVLAAMEAYKNQSSVSHVVKDVLDTLGYYDGNYAVGESNIKDACKELVRLLTVPQPELPQSSVSDEERAIAFAEWADDNWWREGNTNIWASDIGEEDAVRHTTAELYQIFLSIK
jgi:hypothetical protein